MHDGCDVPIPSWSRSNPNVPNTRRVTPGPYHDHHPDRAVDHVNVVVVPSSASSSPSGVVVTVVDVVVINMVQCRCRWL